MAHEVNLILSELGVDSKVAFIDGDNIVPDLKMLEENGVRLENMDRKIALKDSGYPVLTANAYLGSWGIKEALDQGADIVICPRVTDASVVMGPAAWKYNWSRDNFDALAGALTAGHVIECGAQATGGNYAFFQEVKTFKNIGYPIAEIEEDGSFTVTKHPNTGGLVSVGTVTAQLLYEISSTAYLNPDVTAYFNSLHMEQIGENKVYVSGCKGTNPPDTHKVCINLAGGYRNGMEVMLTGLDIEAKAEIFCDALFDLLGGKEQFDEVTVDLHRQDKDNPMPNEEAMAILKITVKSKDQKKVGRIFTAKIIELALANYPGWFSKDSIGSGNPFILYWPALMESKHVKEKVHIDEKIIDIVPTNQIDLKQITYDQMIPNIPPYKEADLKEINFGR